MISRRRHAGAPRGGTIVGFWVFFLLVCGLAGGFGGSSAHAAHSYALVSGPGDADNGRFTIDGDQLKTVAPLDYEEKATYSIRVEVTDGGGQSVQNAFTVSVNDLPDPRVTTQPAMAVGPRSATGNGTLTALGSPSPTQHGVCWGTTPDPDIGGLKTTEGAASAIGAFTSPMTGLSPSTTYYYRAYATNTAGTSYGAVASFTTAPEFAMVTTQVASEVSRTTATGNGNITRLGVPKPTQHGVCWSTSPAPTTADSKTLNGAAGVTGAFTGRMEGLSPGTRYYYRAYATNAAGTAYGAVQAFTTLVPPTVISLDATAVTGTSATGNGNIISLGTPNPTEHGVCWSTTANPTTGNDHTTEGAVSVTGAFTCGITGLSPGTRYHYRAYALNTAGTAYGADTEFTTHCLPPGVNAPSQGRVTSASARLGASIIEVNGAAITERGVYWSTQSGFTPPGQGTKVAETGSWETAGPFIVDVTGLPADTPIYYKGFATNSAGTAFTAQAGFTTTPAPDMAVLGNGQAIADGDTTPGIADHTDFGAARVASGAVTRTFTIQNSGGGPLYLTGTPVKVAVSGPQADEFTVTVQPASPMAAMGGATTFDVQFSPAAPGERTATLSIRNDDPDEAPYDFVIQGTGILPDLSLVATNDKSGDIVLGESWTWCVSLRNTGTANATFHNGQTLLTAELPDTGIRYDAVVISHDTGIANRENIHAVISGNTLSVRADGADVTIGSATARFDMEFMCTPLIGGSFAIPRTRGVCTVDPDAVVLESDETNNTATDAVTVVVLNTWTGAGGDTHWSNGANWSKGVAPVSTETAFIDGDQNLTIDENAVVVGGLCLRSGYTGTLNQGEGALTINGDLIMEGGRFTGGTRAMDINGSFVQTGGTFTATSGEMTVSGDFTHTGGTFLHHTGTVVLDGDDQRVTGSTTFYRLEKTGEKPATLTFEAEKIQTVEGTLTLAGTGAGRLALASTRSGTPWQLLAKGAVILDTLSVRDCRNLGSSRISCGNSLDSGNNTGVDFIALEPPRATLVNYPERVTNALSTRITVGGIGVESYMYRLDGGSWSDEIPVQTPLSITVAGEGAFSLEVTGKNRSGIWQREGGATALTWRVDRTPPVAKLFNAPAGVVGRADVEISVGGEGVATYRYALDEGAFGPVRPVGAPIRLAGLAGGVHTLRVIGADHVGNWQETPGNPDATWTVDPRIQAVPIAGLLNLPEAVTRDTSASIIVCSKIPGEAISAYAYTLDGGGRWDEGRAGEAIELTDLAEGRHTLYVNAANSSGAWQDGADGQSSIAGATSWTWTVDATPPEKPGITVELGVPASTSARLSVPVREALMAYRLWYAEGEITGGNLGDAVAVFCGAAPSPEGVDHVTVGGLTPGKRYYFAVKTVDMAGNASPLSNSPALRTASALPEIHGAAFVAGGMRCDNAGARALEITGVNFLEAAGSNIVRFENARRAFDLSAGVGTVTDLHAELPAGAPAGTYKVRVINKNGVSGVAAGLFTITQAARVPVVTAVAPVVIPAGAVTRVTLSGENLDDIAAVNLIAPDGTATPGTVVAQGDRLIADVAVASDAPEGQHLVEVMGSDGRKNGISAVRLEVYRPVDLRLASGALTTTRMVKPDGGVIPVQTTLATDNRDEVDGVSRSRAKISVTFEAGTVLEEQAGDEAWSDYNGLVNPPRQVPLTEAVEKSLGTDSVLFTLGAEGFLRLKDGGTLFTEVEIPLPEDAPVPSVYYVAPDGSISLAGVDGTRNGLPIAPGGTVLATRPDVPEAGSVTYTIGLLLDHMSTYAAGTKTETDGSGSDGAGGGSYGPCFIGASHGGSHGLFVAMSLLFALVSAGGLMVKRFIPFISLVAALFVMASPQTGVAAAFTARSPWTLTAGVSAGYVGESYKAAAGGTAYDLDVDTVLSPVLRVAYAFSPCLSLEAKAALDLYSGEMAALTADGASSVRGYTLGLGPVWYLAQGNSPGVGPWRPFVHAGVTYRDLKGGLSYAVTDFDPALGAELGAGLRFKNLEVRMSYSHAVFDEGGRRAGVDAADSDLDLSFVALEVAWIVPLHG